jgi:hypothetical protein
MASSAREVQHQEGHPAHDNQEDEERERNLPVQSDADLPESARGQQHYHGPAGGGDAQHHVTDQQLRHDVPRSRNARVQFRPPSALDTISRQVAT